jgi:hypothetical protein
VTEKATLNDVVIQLREIIYELKSINKDYIRLTEKVEKIEKQTAEHHDILTRMNSSFSLFWQRIVPNLTWIILFAGAFAEIKHLAH